MSGPRGGDGAALDDGHYRDRPAVAAAVPTARIGNNRSVERPPMTEEEIRAANVDPPRVLDGPVQLAD